MLSSSSLHLLLSQNVGFKLPFLRFSSAIPQTMQTLKRIATQTELHRLSSTIAKTQFITAANLRAFSSNSKKGGGDDDWNDAWETAWLPPDLSGNNSRAPWETDVNFSSPESSIVLPSDADPETKAFVEDMNENWNERRKPKEERKQNQQSQSGSSLYSLESLKKDYRVKKQRIHAGLWMKEIEKQEEAKLVDSNTFGGGDDIERLLDSCSDIFDSPNKNLENSKAPSASDYKNKPDGWETTSKPQEGNIWEMTQREEDILLQEFERRIAYNKFQIASFIKTHIFSRGRPIDGWKYMIEELGPNARKGKGSVSRLPSLSDASTQPFKEEKTPRKGSLVLGHFHTFRFCLWEISAPNVFIVTVSLIASFDIRLSQCTTIPSFRQLKVQLVQVNICQDPIAHIFAIINRLPTRETYKHGSFMVGGVQDRPGDQGDNIPNYVRDHM